MKHILIIILMTIFTFFTKPVYKINAEVLSSQEPVRGIYVTATHTREPYFNDLLTLVKKTDLNAMVIDVKDDHGNLTFVPDKASPYHGMSYPYIQDVTKLIQTLNQNEIYPIARVVVFKDNVLARSNPNFSFKTKTSVWKNARGDSFTNPFLKEVWEYNVGVAMEAAKAGFKEIQFDYVRFPEKFERFENTLIYSNGDFTSARSDGGQSRIAAVTSFVKYASEKLKPYKVKVSVDVFGNATVIPEARGIGQNFSKIAEHVDVISAMIYPSHWSPMFGIQKPDKEPYRLVREYAKVENKRLEYLQKRPQSRPWIQDFTASWLGNGNYKVYGKKEIEEQINGLRSEGIHEFLIWNANNKYTKNVDYTPF